MVRQLESLITNDCLNYLTKLEKEGKPIYHEHRSGSVGFSVKKGIPDLFVVINGIHIECELKTPVGKRSTMQEKYEVIFKSKGIKYICPHSFDEFKTYIDSLL